MQSLIFLFQKIHVLVSSGVIDNCSKSIYLHILLTHNSFHEDFILLHINLTLISFDSGEFQK
jgi:hypothetical protein